MTRRRLSDTGTRRLHASIIGHAGSRRNAKLAERDLGRIAQDSSRFLSNFPAHGYIKITDNRKRIRERPCEPCS